MASQGKRRVSACRDKFSKALDCRTWREPANRWGHTTAVAGDELYLWAGCRLNDRAGANKQPPYPSPNIEVFNVNTGRWEQRTTRGTPPPGACGYSCVAVGNELCYFGGGQGNSGLYHNSVHALSTSAIQWRVLIPSSSLYGVPMRKSYSGMVHFIDERGKHFLYVLGGFGPSPPGFPQYGSQYPKHSYGIYTNEQHIFSLSASKSILSTIVCVVYVFLLSDNWSSPSVNGQSPPPCIQFTLTAIGEKRAAMYGGCSGSNILDHFFIVDLGPHCVVC